MLSKTYSEMRRYDTYLDRVNYLSLKGYSYKVPNRTISERFYRSKEWRAFCKEIIARDLGYDLGVPGIQIYGKVYVHHIEPITEEDILGRNVYKLFNPENVITLSLRTHNLIHYGNKLEEYIERKPGDTKLW